MTWSNDDHQHTTLHIVTAYSNKEDNTTVSSSKNCQDKTIVCPSCGHTMKFQEQGTGLQNLPGLPAGVKFDPSDQEILQHLEAKVLSDVRKLHPLIDEFIPSIEGENGICYTHPEKLPGVNKDGQVRHFFHRPSKAYTTGTRKRRKVHTEADDGGETRWHKTGKTRPVTTNGSIIKGYKKILVLYTNYGRQRKPEKTNWVMHQYHLGDNEEEKDGELVVSKVFYQTQPRQCGSMKEALNIVSGGNNNKSGIEIENTFIRSGEGLVDYYGGGNNNNNLNPSFIGPFDIGRESVIRGGGGPHHPHQLIPDAVVRGDGSSTSFIHLPSNASKGK